MPVIILLLSSVFFASCSSLPARAKVGECYRNNWHDGLWKVSQVTEDQVTLLEVPSFNQSLGRVKVVGPWYGGWQMETCPKADKTWATPLPEKKD